MRLLHLFAALTLLLGSSLAHAATLNFNGAAVDNCSQSQDGLQYTCASLALGSTDVIIIGSAYGVTVNRSLAMSYNQGLTMSGNATLTVKGSLDIKEINPPNLKVTGGSLSAEGGTFLMGSQEQTITANVSATTIKMGSNNVKVTGKISAKGPVEIASGSVINGPISGTVVNILPASTRIQGDITATTSLTIGSGSQVTGNLTSPVIDLKASGLLVTGNVTASNKLTIASGNGIKGNVDAGEVTLDSSNAYITGNAKVDHITLGWQGRVQKTITCKAYTPSNPCSCVTNNSGWSFNEPMGPKCGPGTQAGPDHFQITHPPSALTCAAAPVTVTACADASCSSVYTGAAQVTLTPGGATAQINNTQPPTGMVTSSVGQTTAASNVQLGLTSVPATTGALVCKSSLDNSTTNCQMAFLTSALQISGVPRYAEEEGIINISAKQASSSNPNTCVPLFAGQSKTLNLKCTYANPASGTLPARIQGQSGTYVALAANANAGSSCSVAGASIQLTFDANGLATPKMLYADVGALGLIATYASGSGSDSGLTMTGSGTVIVAPKKFLFTQLAPTQRAGLAAVPLVAGTTITLSAVNALDAVTKNFGNESVVAVQKVVLGNILLAPVYENPNVNKPTNPTVGGDLDFVKKGGVIAAPPLIWPEVGKINFTATLQDGYLGSSLTSPGASDAVLFYPHHFVTELVITTKDGKEFPFPCSTPLACAGNRAVYSRQPFDLTIRAQTSGGVDTKNFDVRNGDINKTQVSLIPYDAATGENNYPPTAPSGSTLTNDAKVPSAVKDVPVSSFKEGVASLKLVYSFPAAYAVPKEPKALASPTDLLLRATYAYPAADNVSSAPADGMEAQLTVLTGRLMVPHDYGSERYPVRLAVQAQYWDGKTWVASLLDSISAFDNTLVVFANCKKTLVCKDFLLPVGTIVTYTVDKGILPPNRRLILAAPGAGKTGSVDVSVPGIAHLPSTVGTVVFGVFKSGPVIYLREMY